jgi:hypothetical protein
MDRHTGYPESAFVIFLSIHINPGIILHLRRDRPLINPIEFISHLPSNYSTVSILTASFYRRLQKISSAKIQTALSTEAQVPLTAARWSYPWLLTILTVMFRQKWRPWALFGDPYVGRHWDMPTQLLMALVSGLTHTIYGVKFSHLLGNYNEIGIVFGCGRHRFSYPHSKRHVIGPTRCYHSG